MFSYPASAWLIDRSLARVRAGGACRSRSVFVFAVDLGVDLRGGDRAVAEQGMDVLDVDIVFQQRRPLRRHHRRFQTPENWLSAVSTQHPLGSV